jgi:hypothetical protein
MATPSSEQLQALTNKVKEVEELTAEQRQLEQDMELEAKMLWLDGRALSNHNDLVKDFAKDFNMSYTKADRILDLSLKEYTIENKNIPDLVKDMRMFRRTLKGEKRLDMSKSIDNLIDAYADHLDKSIDKIYWASPYKSVIKDMTCSESQIIKLSKIQDIDTKRQVIDSLCKYWENKLEIKDMPLNKQYISISKEMTAAKKDFKRIIKSQSSTKGIKKRIKENILKSVCESPGISSREIHEALPDNLKKMSSPQIISKLAISQNITNVNGAYYKINDDIKKNVWAYTAAFIDSDGYITMDRNNNPRVGLVATGERGKAFMLELHKCLGMGRLHLDQKSPQDTRPVNRLNFYSQKDVHDLLTKCRPHFRMKGPNADILLELVRIKKGFKKQPWAKGRMGELFKLMKYHNHRDNVNFDFSAFDIDLDSISKLEENSKMSWMDKLERDDALNLIGVNNT